MNDPTASILSASDIIVGGKSSKKRNSVCLNSNQGQSLLPSQGDNLSRFGSCYGSFRKARRFSDSTARDSPSLVQPSKDMINSSSRRPGRRSSLITPKNNWPEGTLPMLDQQPQIQVANPMWDCNFPPTNNNHFPVGGGLNPLPLPSQPMAMESFLPFDIPSLGTNPGLNTSRYDINKVESKVAPPVFYLDDMRNIGLVKSESVPVEKKLCRKGAWTKEEDELLIEHGGNGGNKNKNWTQIAEKIPGRTAKQCRERWCFNLDPSIKKEQWSVDEDLLLIQKQNVVGNKWAQIAQLLPGRTENAVKTRFKSILRARKREWKPQEDLLLLELQQQLGANWEGIASHLENHRTKHAVKMRFRELQQGLKDVKPPESGSARQTVRQMFYPQETINQVSDYYKSLADGSLQLEKMKKGPILTSLPMGHIPSPEQHHIQVMPQVQQYQQQQAPTLDDFYSVFYGEDDLVIA